MLELLEHPAATGDFTRFAADSTARLRGRAFLLCRDWHLAQDLTQATLTKLFVCWPRAGGSDNLPAYAQKVLLRVWLDHQRRRSVSEAVGADLREPAYTISPDLRLTVLSAVDRLPARDRTIVLMRYFADRSVEQVADDLGLSVTVVKSQTRRSLLKLRRMLATDRPALFG